MFLFVLTFALYTFVLHADWWFQTLINSSPTTTKMFFDGHYKMMIRTNFVCSDGKPFSIRQKMLKLATTEMSSNVTCEYWLNKILLSHKFVYGIPVLLSINIPSSAFTRSTDWKYLWNCLHISNELYFVHKDVHFIRRKTFQKCVPFYGRYLFLWHYRV